MTDVITATIFNITGALKERMNPEYNLLAIDIIKEVNKIPSAQLILLDGDATEKTFEISNTTFFQPGQKLEIQLRYEGEADSIVFVGRVVKHRIQANRQQSLLTVYLKDAAIKLTQQRKNAVFRAKKDSTIIQDILKSVITKDQQSSVTDLKVKSVSPTTPIHQEIVQFYCTDWDFLMSRAEANGLWVMVNDGEVRVQKPDLTASSSKKVLEYGIDEIYDIEMEADIREQYGTVETSAWDIKTQNLAQPQAGEPLELGQKNLDPQSLAATIGAEKYQMVSGGELTPDELKAWADAGLVKARWSLFKGRVCIPGVADVQLGGLLELKGVGDRFNGTTLITGIRHQVDENGWQTDIQFGVSAPWFSSSDNIIDPPANGLLPAVNGLQIGIVDQYMEDRDKKFRVKVKIPRLTQTTATQPADINDGLVWARLAVLDAGLTADGKQGRGTFFRPEPGDEVILGFLNDDPRQAVILGAVYSEKNAPPKPVSQENAEKGIVTKEKLKLLFNDQEKSIRLETPKTNRLILMDEDGAIYIVDENKNQFTMDSNGVQITSDKDITIAAKGNITLQGSKVDVK